MLADDTDILPLDNSVLVLTETLNDHLTPISYWFYENLLALNNMDCMDKTIIKSLYIIIVGLDNYRARKDKELNFVC